MKAVCSLVLLLAFASPAFAQNNLATLANSMSAGSWAELPTTNMNILLKSSGRTTYSVSGSWDPGRLKMHFIGRDHTDDISGAYHITYEAGTNAWTLGTDFPGGFTHGFDHNAVDTTSGMLYAREYGYETDIWKLPLGGSWSSEQVPYTGDSLQVNIGIHWWDGAITGGGPTGALMIYNCGATNGEIILKNEATSTWFANVKGFGGTSSYSCVMDYSKVHNVAIFGGGIVNQNKVWRLNSNATVTSMPDSPVTWGIQRSNVVSDPVSGDFLFFGANQFWQYNPTGTGTWTDMTSTRMPPAGLVNNPSGGFSVISFPIENYGVVAYASIFGASVTKLALYKHSNFTPPSTPTLALVLLSLSLVMVLPLLVPRLAAEPAKVSVLVRKRR